ncbi:MAG: F0F1 ATP synthase subunit B [Pseudomonadota bacterium]|nr:F0F1 ATP synthase subunit B [Pseudomonadota bacterium]
MDINLTFVIQGFAFFAVAWLVMKFGWPHIIAAIEERQQKIAEGLAAADNAQRNLAQAEEKVNEELKAARSKANEIIEQAHQRANQIVDAAKVDAIAEGQRQKAVAESEIVASANRAREELRRQVSMLAVSGAEKLLRREIDAASHKALLDELAAQLSTQTA